MRAHFAVDELGILRTLGIAVAGAVSRSSLIGSVLKLAAICRHVEQVGCAVRAARPGADSVRIGEGRTLNCKGSQC